MSTSCSQSTMDLSMPLLRRTFVQLTAAAATTTAEPGIASAADAYLEGPITLIVPYVAGGPTDTIGRIIVDGMREALGATIIIENVAGASGTIGIGKFARSVNDGYTLGLGNWPTFVLNGAIFN